MICKIHSPTEVVEIYTRLINDINIPTGVLFDWRNTEMKKVLLIAGGGTLGTYTAEELLRLGHGVDILCLEDKESAHENLKYYKANATLDYLRDLFTKNHYHGRI